MKTEIKVNKKFINNVQQDKLNNLDLRSDIENNNIYDTVLKSQGYVGNRPSDFEGENHEDDTWAIDCFTKDGFVVDSYLYTSEYEYNEDLKLLNLITK